MKITLINTFDVQGGAARAAYRLHQGLLKLNQDSVMLSRYKASSDKTVQPLQIESELNLNALKLSAIQSHYINLNRTSISNTLFSLPYPGLDLRDLPRILQSDIINLHWIALLQSPSTLKKLFSLDKPIVWTLHDMWAFTGGCHYSAGCQNYEQFCLSCPQIVENDPLRLANSTLEDKIEQFASANLTIVTPSHWLADCAQRSRLFRNQRIEIIPYSLETDVFVPLPKPDTKEKLGIRKGITTLLFGAETAVEIRKGFAELVQAMQLCTENSQFRALADAHQVEILCFGQPSEFLSSLSIPVRSLGSITSDLELSTIYSAADFFILPSLEDNLPNTILEAMSCGTPVIGFDVGGIPDLVKDRVTGRLVPYKDISQLAAAILECVFNPAQVQQMGQTCRQVIEENYSLTTQAERYLSLYKDLLGIPETDRVPFLSDSQTQESISQSEILVSLDVSCGSAFTEVLDQILLKALPLKLYDTQIALSDTQSQLQLTQAQLHETQTQSQDILKQLHDAVDQLRNTHDQFQITQTQLHTTQVQLYATQSQLQTTQSHLQDTKIQLKDTQKELAQSQTEHQKVQGQLARSQTKLQRTQERLTQTQTWLQEAQQEIESMKSSKFWKLRTRWIKLRDRLPLLRKS